MAVQVWSGQKGDEGKMKISADTFYCGCSAVSGKNVSSAPTLRSAAYWSHGLEKCTLDL